MKVVTLVALLVMAAAVVVIAIAVPLAISASTATVPTHKPRLVEVVYSNDGDPVTCLEDPANGGLSCDWDNAMGN